MICHFWFLVRIVSFMFILFFCIMPVSAKDQKNNLYTKNNVYTLKDNISTTISSSSCGSSACPFPFVVCLGSWLGSWLGLPARVLSWIESCPGFLSCLCVLRCLVFCVSKCLALVCLVLYWLLPGLAASFRESFLVLNLVCVVLYRVSCVVLVVSCAVLIVVSWRKTKDKIKTRRRTRPIDKKRHTTKDWRQRLDQDSDKARPRPPLTTRQSCLSVPRPPPHLFPHLYFLFWLETPSSHPPYWVSRGRRRPLVGSEARVLRFSLGLEVTYPPRTHIRTHVPLFGFGLSHLWFGSASFLSLIFALSHLCFVLVSSLVLLCLTLS